ncbi:glycosyltransferase family 4 protein [Candidatus Woesearchaeota archaeon]|nr:glycosyltransferase family 4 protein [Candidatus Woesearchaeota archaeon]
MRIVYIYYGNHYLFDSWAKSIGAEARPFVPLWLYDFNRLKKKGASIRNNLSSTLRKFPVFLQAASLLNSLFIPKADVYILENMACATSIYFKRTRNSKVILFNGDQFFLDLSSAGGTRKIIAKKLMKKVDGIVSISKLYKDICEKHLDLPNKMVYPYAEVEKYLKKQADLESKSVAFLGYIVLLKGIDILIDAFNELEDEYKDKLYLVGAVVDDIPQVTANKDNPKIVCTGWCDNPEEYLRKCSIYANPARREAFGINIIEAMCMGLVPIVSGNCGAAEIVKEVSEELIIPVDKEKLKQKIRWLNSNQKIKRELSEKCRKVGRTYTKEKSVAEFRRAFAELLTELAK